MVAWWGTCHSSCLETSTYHSLQCPLSTRPPLPTRLVSLRSQDPATDWAPSLSQQAIAFHPQPWWSCRVGTANSIQNLKSPYKLYEQLYSVRLHHTLPSEHKGKAKARAMLSSSTQAFSLCQRKHFSPPPLPVGNSLPFRRRNAQICQNAESNSLQNTCTFACASKCEVEK